jgi:hypothetical protein
MTADEDLARARHAHEIAIKKQYAAEAQLRKAGIKALAELEQEFGSQAAVAIALHYSEGTVSKLRLSGSDTRWKPRGPAFYKAMDKATESRHELVRLRDGFDQAKRAVDEAQVVVHDAQAAVDADIFVLGAAPSSSAAVVTIDDVHVSQDHRRVGLDVRVRNTGTATANLTRVAVRILDRERYLAAYAPSADYDLLVDGDGGETGVGHSLLPGEVDSFLVRLGFAEEEFGHAFTAELDIRYNGDQCATYRPLRFDSCFD